MCNRTTQVVSTLVLLGACLSAAAHETDQFTTPAGREFADLGPGFSAWMHERIERAVNQVNGEIKAAQGDREALKTLHSSNHMAKAVNKELPWAMDMIEGLEKDFASEKMRKRHPGYLTTYKHPTVNIMQRTHFFLDPRQLFRLFLSGTSKVNGVYLGTDKIGHFTDMGMNYWRQYQKSLDAGKSEEQATRDAIGVGTSGLVFSERGMLGYMTAGAYSNGDMAANYLGFLFYKNLTQPVMLKGVKHPPMLVRQGDYWRFAPHIRKESFFAAFVSEHMDEALNPSHYEPGMRGPVGQAIAERSSVVLERYKDEHGYRRPAAFFGAKVRELSTYYGMDYGHIGRPSELLSIDRICYGDNDGKAADRLGLTALHCATGSPKAMQQVLADARDVNVRVRSAEFHSSDWGSTPLHFAARDGKTECISLLLSRGADVNATDDRGATPLHRAADRRAAAELLLSTGARLDAVTKCGETPLHFAARDAQGGEVVRLLLERGADVERVDRDGWTPLHEAAKAGNELAVRMLLAAGASPAAPDALGVTPLHLAAAANAPGAVDAMLVAGANINLRDDFGCTPLHDAAMNQAEEVVALLVRAGADTRLADAYGNAPLGNGRGKRQDSVAGFGRDE